MGDIALDNFCRLCLKESFSLVNMFSHKIPSGDVVYKILNFVYDLKVHHDDGLPSRICTPCLWRVIEFDACKKNVRDAELEILRLTNKKTVNSDSVSDVQADDGICGVEDDVSEEENDAGEDGIDDDVDNDCVGLESEDVDEAEISVKEEFEAVKLAMLKELPTGDCIAQGHSSEADLNLGKESENVSVNLESSVVRVKDEFHTIDWDAPREITSSTENTVEGHSSKAELHFDEEDASISNEMESIEERTVKFEDMELAESPSESRTSQETTKTPKENKPLQFLGEWEVLPGNPTDPRLGYACNVCGSIFASKRALSRHTSVHDADRTIKCRTCSLGFKTVRGRDLHELRHRRDETNSNMYQKGPLKKAYRCHVCAKRYRTKDLLSRHFNIHTDKFSCATCGRSFRCGSHLKMHMTIHSREKHFSCSVCEKTFHLKESLEHHLITHSVERPFSCNICDKKFKTSQAKNRHELIHYRVS